VTQTQFDSRCASLLRAFAREVERKSMEDARRKFREEGLIYVRRHVVEAYFRRRKPRKTKH